MLAWKQKMCWWGKNAYIFKNGEFDIFIEQLSTMNEDDFNKN